MNNFYDLEEDAKKKEEENYFTFISFHTAAHEVARDMENVITFEGNLMGWKVEAYVHKCERHTYVMRSV